MKDSIQSEAYQGDYSIKIDGAKIHAKVAKRTLVAKHFLYITVVILSLCIPTILPSDASFSHFGPALITGATLVTGICVTICFRAQNYFSAHDPAFGSMHLDRLKSRAERNDDEYSKYRYELSTLHAETISNTSRAIQNCIFWELILLTIGTLVWGFWDILFCGNV